MKRRGLVPAVFPYLRSRRAPSVQCIPKGPSCPCQVGSHHKRARDTHATQRDKRLCRRTHRRLSEEEHPEKQRGESSQDGARERDSGKPCPSPIVSDVRSE